MKYTTSNLYITSGDAIPGAGSLPALTLAQVIARAENAIDSFMSFSLLIPSGFAPGVARVVQRGFNVSTRRIRFPTPPVPIRTIQSVRILMNQGALGEFAILSPSEVAINQYEQYCEITALTVQYSTAGIVWGLGLSPPICEIDVTTGYYLSYYGDTLYDAGDGRTFQATRAFWANTYDLQTSLQPSVLPPIPPVVYVNGVVQLTSTYTVNYALGQVLFNTSQTGNNVTVDYTATIPDLVQSACVDQVTWLLQQRNLNQMGIGGLELVRNGEQQIRRSRSDDIVEDQLCARARLKLAAYKSIAVG